MKNISKYFGLGLTSLMLLASCNKPGVIAKILNQDEIHQYGMELKQVLTDPNDREYSIKYLNKLNTFKIDTKKETYYINRFDQEQAHLDTSVSTQLIEASLDKLYYHILNEYYNPEGALEFKTEEFLYVRNNKIEFIEIDYLDQEDPNNLKYNKRTKDIKIDAVEEFKHNFAYSFEEYYNGNTAFPRYTFMDIALTQRSKETIDYFLHYDKYKDHLGYVTQLDNVLTYSYKDIYRQGYGTYSSNLMYEDYLLKEYDSVIDLGSTETLDHYANESLKLTPINSINIKYFE